MLAEISGETHLRMVPNAEHALIVHQEEVTLNILTYINLLQANTPRPEFNYTLVKSNTTASITVYTNVSDIYVFTTDLDEAKWNPTSLRQSLVC